MVCKACLFLVGSCTWNAAVVLLPWLLHIRTLPSTLKVFQAFHAMTGVFRGGEREVPMVAMAAKPAMKSILFFKLVEAMQMSSDSRC